MYEKQKQVCLEQVKYGEFMMKMISLNYEILFDIVS
jgi:hypothetical protein